MLLVCVLLSTRSVVACRSWREAKIFGLDLVHVESLRGLPPPKPGPVLGVQRVKSGSANPILCWLKHAKGVVIAHRISPAESCKVLTLFRLVLVCCIRSLSSLPG